MGNVEKKSLIFIHRPYMPNGSNRMTNTRIKPKMPASTPGLLQEISDSVTDSTNQADARGGGNVGERRRNGVAKNGDGRR